MNYVITGSIGHISKPIVNALVAANHQVTVLTSKTERVADIESLGATAKVGSVEDAAFITSAFAGADAVYLMIPPKWKTDNWFGYQQTVANNYVNAITANNIKYVVQLSSIGAHMRKGAGPIDGLGYLEEQLLGLQNVNTIALRPSYFFYNLFSQIGLVKQAGIFGANYGGTNEKLILVDTNDIAAVAAEKLLDLSFSGFTTQYIASDEVSTDDIAKVLGEAIGKPGTPWVTFTDEQALQGMLGAGLDAEIANGYATMGAAIRSGAIQEDYWKNRPTLGKYKLADFAKAFAAAYNA
jgi:uncharacterized protein YbjT (DUF2867 family)